MLSGDGVPLSDSPLQVLVEGNFSLPRQWRRAAFAGQMMLGAELLLPPWERPFGCSHLILLPSHGGHASTFITERALRTFPAAAAAPFRIRRRLGPNRHHSIFAARLCRVHSTFASDDRNRSPIGRAPIHSLVLPSLSFGARTDGRKEGPEGECTTNEAHPEHALPSLPASLGRRPAPPRSLFGSDPMHFR